MAVYTFTDTTFRKSCSGCYFSFISDGNGGLLNHENEFPHGV
jgi:hypothetical protein